ncbi:hypothetical protein V1478_010065 [Vespula squamosa]|uniref:Uncharacterized protein n=1 Tax=Vespula squamosa TaxID=30214 RepID=A0ABD2AIN2_VESSQ
MTERKEFGQFTYFIEKEQRTTLQIKQLAGNKRYNIFQNHMKYLNITILNCITNFVHPIVKYFQSNNTFDKYISSKYFISLIIVYRCVYVQGRKKPIAIKQKLETSIIDIRRLALTNFGGNKGGSNKNSSNKNKNSSNINNNSNNIIMIMFTIICTILIQHNILKYKMMFGTFKNTSPHEIFHPSKTPMEVSGKHGLRTILIKRYLLAATSKALFIRRSSLKSQSKN